jgi:hypothetical protein
VRCFDQKRRFGFDALQPMARFVDGLSKRRVKDRAGALVDNPLLAARAGFGPRSPSLVMFLPIVGVPWQDLARPVNPGNGQLSYLDASGLLAENRWPMLLGEPEQNTPPLDPFMRESIDPRSGKHPFLSVQITPETSLDPQANPINGHEQAVTQRSDLQFACTFALPMARECEPADPNCRCSPTKSGEIDDVVAVNSPLCQPPTGGPASSTQYFAGAYPGARQLTLAKELGVRAGAASLCPKTLDEAAPDFGYQPAFDSLLQRLAPSLR